jgi:hypothetical protein
MYKEDPYVAAKGCKKEIGQFKTLNYNILNFRMLNNKTRDIYWK